MLLAIFVYAFGPIARLKRGSDTQRTGSMDAVGDKPRPYVDIARIFQVEGDSNGKTSSIDKERYRW